MKKAVAKLESDRLYSKGEIFVRHDADRTAMISLINVQHTNLNPSDIFISIYAPYWQTIMRNKGLKR